MLGAIKKMQLIPRIGMFDKTRVVMAKNTSILLDDYFNEFISQQINSGRFSSASEVVRTALRMFEQEEIKKKELINELKKGENSGFIEKFNKTDFLGSMHSKYSGDEL